MYSTSVGFTPLQDDSIIRPVMKAGHRDSIWVITPTADKAKILEAAKRKLDACYGGEYTDFVVYDCLQFQH